MRDGVRRGMTALGVVVVLAAAVVVAVGRIGPDPAQLTVEDEVAAAQHTGSTTTTTPSSPTADPVLVQVEVEPRPTTTTTVAPTTTTAAPTTTTAPVPRPEAIRALVDFPFEQTAPAWRLRWLRPQQQGLLGFADQPRREISVFVRSDLSDDELAFTLAHEMGHALDTTLLDAEDRAAYRRLRGIRSDLAWSWEWGGGSDGDYHMPAGDFAEAFAVAVTGLDEHWRSQLGAPPTPAEQEALLALLGTG